MAGLLVSVRSAAEAETALAAGADWIDVKEPARGALGRADDATIQAIATAVDGRAPLSAALGEVVDKPRVPVAFAGLVKLGLAGCAGRAWQDEVLSRWLSERGLAPASHHPPLVLAAYADFDRASAPPPTQILDFAIAHQLPAFLLDTWQKDGRTLLDWLPLDKLKALGVRCREAGLLFVLAGSLGEAEIERVLPLNPGLIAVRGAACRKGKRTAEVDGAAVRRLAELVRPGGVRERPGTRGLTPLGSP